MSPRSSARRYGMAAERVPEPELADIDPAATAVVAGIVPMTEIANFFDRSFSTLAAVISGQNLTIVGPAFARYHGPPTDRADLEVGFPVDGAVKADGTVGPGSLPGGRVRAPGAPRQLRPARIGLGATRQLDRRARALAVGCVVGGLRDRAVARDGPRRPAHRALLAVALTAPRAARLARGRSSGVDGEEVLLRRQAPEPGAARTWLAPAAWPASPPVFTIANRRPAARICSMANAVSADPTPRPWHEGSTASM